MHFGIATPHSAAQRACKPSTPMATEALRRDARPQAFVRQGRATKPKGLCHHLKTKTANATVGDRSRQGTQSTRKSKSIFTAQQDDVAVGVGYAGEDATGFLVFGGQAGPLNLIVHAP